MCCVYTYLNLFLFFTFGWSHFVSEINKMWFFFLERPIPFDHMMYEHLQKWGPRREEVKFFLRHEDSPTESSEQGR